LRELNFSWATFLLCQRQLSHHSIFPGIHQPFLEETTMLISILKHLYLLPGYVIRIVWTVWVIIGGYKKMDWGDGVKFLASYTGPGLAFYSLLGWVAIGFLVFADHGPRQPSSSADESRVFNVGTDRAPSIDKRLELEPPNPDRVISDGRPVQTIPLTGLPLTQADKAQSIAEVNAQAPEVRPAQVMTSPQEAEAQVEKNGSPLPEVPLAQPGQSL
jgi:hypothetical protein